MKKPSLNEFIQSSNRQDIQDPTLILSIVEKMWSIPFSSVFHKKCRYMNPTPWEYIYEEFTDQEKLVPAGIEAFRMLPLGEIVLILNEEIRRKKKAKTYLEPNAMDVLFVFGNLHRYFM